MFALHVILDDNDAADVFYREGSDGIINHRARATCLKTEMRHSIWGGPKLMHELHAFDDALLLQLYL